MMLTSKLTTLFDGREGCRRVYEADRELVARMRAGDQRAFESFFNASAPRLAAFVVRRSGLDAASVEDVVQNSMIKAVRNLAAYRGEAALFTWLTEICRHELIDSQRRNARRPGHDSLDDATGAHPLGLQLRMPEHQEPAEEIERHQHRVAIVRTLNSLPERYSLALEAKYGDGLTIDEIASLLGLTAIAAQSLLARARSAFREHWSQQQGALGARGGRP
jgi:RNA polymerase sigma-70 factor (ECF subfamily)